MIPQIIRYFEKTKRFLKEYKSLPGRIKDKADMQFRRLQNNFNHPSLRISLHDKERRIYEASINMKYRFTFKLEGDTVKLRRIGDHSIYENP